MEEEAGKKEVMMVGIKGFQNAKGPVGQTSPSTLISAVAGEASPVQRPSGFVCTKKLSHRQCPSGLTKSFSDRRTRGVSGFFSLRSRWFYYNRGGRPNEGHLSVK
jgi:hypothetical protein